MRMTMKTSLTRPRSPASAQAPLGPPNPEAGHLVHARAGRRLLRWPLALAFTCAIAVGCATTSGPVTPELLCRLDANLGFTDCVILGLVESISPAVDGERARI